MDIGQPLARNQPEPEVERHRGGIAGVLNQSLANVKIRLLKYVGGINAAREPTVKPQPDHSAQAIAISVKERSQRSFIAGQGALDENLVVVACRIGHQFAP
jgi:hypothetical protein